MLVDQATGNVFVDLHSLNAMLKVVIFNIYDQRAITVFILIYPYIGRAERIIRGTGKSEVIHLLLQRKVHQLFHILRYIIGIDHVPVLTHAVAFNYANAIFLHIGRIQIGILRGRHNVGSNLYDCFHAAKKPLIVESFLPQSFSPYVRISECRGSEHVFHCVLRIKRQINTIPGFQQNLVGCLNILAVAAEDGATGFHNLIGPVPGVVHLLLVHIQQGIHAVFPLLLRKHLSLFRSLSGFLVGIRPNRLELLRVNDAVAPRSQRYQLFVVRLTFRAAIHPQEPIHPAQGLNMLCRLSALVGAKDLTHGFIPQCTPSHIAFMDVQHGLAALYRVVKPLLHLGRIALQMCFEVFRAALGAYRLFLAKIVQMLLKILRIHLCVDHFVEIIHCLIQRQVFQDLFFSFFRISVA